MLLLCSHASNWKQELQETKKERNESQQKSEKWIAGFFTVKRRIAPFCALNYARFPARKTFKIVGAIGGLIAWV